MGLDAGVKNQLTLSNGLVINAGIPITRKVRQLHRKLSRRRLHGRNWLKTNLKLNREYRRIANSRADIRHKIVSRIVSTYDSVAI
ncbi:MAG: transposase [Candidatus Verstraetearchaeota archaeon]|nr:transposase [Candidatus Verstraetearchaeota archaeon]